MKFRSQYELGPEMMSFSQDQIKQEPMYANPWVWVAEWDKAEVAQG